MAGAYMVKVGDYNVSIRSELGSGTFGKVYKGRHETRHIDVAAKKILLDGSQESKDYALTEVRALSRVKHHPYILHLLHHQFLDYMEFDNEVHELWLVTEFCKEGNLTEYHKKHEVLFEDKVRISRQCASAVAFLHNMEPSILHRDLKPANILIKKVDGADTVKIADFGLAQSSSSKTVFSTLGGSLVYMAPEFFASHVKYRKSIDVYSLGVLCGHLVRAVPGQNLEDEAFLGPSMGQSMWRAHTEKKPLPVAVEIRGKDSEVEKSMKRIILEMTKYNPGDRPTMDDVEMQLITLQDQLEYTKSCMKKAQTESEPPNSVHKEHCTKQTVTDPRMRVKQIRDSQATALPRQFENLAVTEKRDGSPSQLPTLIMVAHINLPDDTQFPGLSTTNEVLIGREESNTISKYKFSHGKYTEMWNKPAPAGMTYVCNKFISPIGKIILHDFGKITHTHSGDLEMESKWDVNGKGLSALTDDIMLYGVRHIKQQVALAVHGMDHKVLHNIVLPRHDRREWSGQLAVCIVPGSGCVIVADSDNKWIDAFSHAGDHLHHKSLPYTADYGAHQSAASEHQVFIIEYESSNLHVHSSETGEHVGCLTVQDLGLQEGDVIGGVGYGQGDFLHLLVGNDSTGVIGLRQAKITDHL